MKIAIKPVDLFIPGKGIVSATHLEVSVGQLELGVRANGNYELQAEDLTDPAKPKYTPLSGGRAELTAEQFAVWGVDDQYFAKSIALNAGLTPA